MAWWLRTSPIIIGTSANWWAAWVRTAYNYIIHTSNMYIWMCHPGLNTFARSLCDRPILFFFSFSRFVANGGMVETIQRNTQWTKIHCCWYSEYSRIINWEKINLVGWRCNSFYWAFFQKCGNEKLIWFQYLFPFDDTNIAHELANWICSCHIFPPPSRPHSNSGAHCVFAVHVSHILCHSKNIYMRFPQRIHLHICILRVSVSICVCERWIRISEET